MAEVKSPGETEREGGRERKREQAYCSSERARERGRKRERARKDEKRRGGDGGRGDLRE